ncbi:hypothetical protein [Streptomonospora litoralis]|uniref:Uncharacterized protein n=1 Tax=Streptomonospora litoralis TaxID=2498135 RepID=A0A4P6Q699_9ACTN|nr:hypothetical protein [Streptomonospora litoralis]QBI56296.1 hypothetical protein EKD16_22715 [Streptomonospora litoralis]
MIFKLNGKDVNDFNDVADTLRAGNGYGHAYMVDLRNLTGWKKLSGNIRKEISSSLYAVGVGHLPQELPGNQNEEVRLYALDSRIGEIVAAVLSPSYRGDTLLQDLVADSSDAGGKLKRIRQILNSPHG